MTSARSTGSRGFALAVGALLLLHVLAAWLFVAGGQAPLKWDSLEYWSMAKSLVASGGFPEDNSVHRPPGYPAFLALHRWVFGKSANVAVVVVQQALVAGTALVTAALSGRLARSRAAFLVGLAVPLAWLEARYLAGYLLADLLMMALLAGFALAFVAWTDRPSPPRAVAMGLLLGAGILVKPVLQLAWVPALAAIAYRVFQERERRSRALIHGGAFGLAVLVVVGPWMAHNRALHGEAFLTKFAGRSLWMAVFGPGGARLGLPQSPEAEIVRRSAQDPTRAWGVFQSLVVRGRTPVEAEDLMVGIVVDAVLDEPRPFLASVGTRWIRYWTTPKRHGYWRNNESLTTDAHEWQRTYEIDRVAALHAEHLDRLRLPGRWHLLAPLAALLGTLALCRRPDRRPAAVLFLTLVAYLSLVVATSIVPQYRYRIPVDPLVVATAVGGAVSLLADRSRTRGS